MLCRRYSKYKCSLYELLLNKLPPSCGFAVPMNVVLCCYSSQFKDRSQDMARDSGQRVVLLGLRNSSEKLLFRFTSGGKVSIFVRKALQVRPRDRAVAACRLRKLAGQDLRFSTKMILGAGSRNSRAACRNCLIILGDYKIEFTQSEIHPHNHPHYPQIHPPHCSHNTPIGFSNHFVIPN